MKRFTVYFIIVPLLMVAAWITGAGFTYTALRDQTYSTLYWSIPLAALGAVYFVFNIVWMQRKHDINKAI